MGTLDMEFWKDTQGKPLTIEDIKEHLKAIHEQSCWPVVYPPDIVRLLDKWEKAKARELKARTLEVKVK